MKIMPSRKLFSTTSQTILLFAALLALLTLMGCASGTEKTGEPWKFNEDTIKEVKTKCKNDFEPATSGTLEELWKNKRLILRQSRDCSEAASTLAEQAEGRNKVIGE